MVDEADIFTSENLGSPDAEVGARPKQAFFRPKRERGFHRALKRQESWALLEKGYALIMADLASGLYSPSTPDEYYFGLVDRNKLDNDLSAIAPTIRGLDKWLK